MTKCILCKTKLVYNHYTLDFRCPREKEDVVEYNAYMVDNQTSKSICFNRKYYFQCHINKNNTTDVYIYPYNERYGGYPASGGIPIRNFKLEDLQFLCRIKNKIEQILL